MPGFVGKKVFITLGLALIFLIVNAVVSYRAIETLIENNRLVVHTENVIEATAAVLSSLQEAESGQRGFLLTGNELYLESYNAAVAQIESEIDRLQELTSDNPNHQKRMPILRQLAAERLEILQLLIDLRRREGLDAVTGRLDQGRLLMLEVRQIILEIDAEVKRLMQLRIEQSKTSGQRAGITILIAMLLNIALLSLVYYLMARDVAERNRVETVLQEAHDNLEAKVAERTEELAGSNTELERSNRELQDFAFVASHDLQEPLRKIQAFGDRLKTKQGDLLDKNGRDYLDRMQNAAGRMHVLINDLLMFSRVTTKAQPFVSVELDILTQDVLIDLEVRIQQTDGRVEVDDLPVIEADPLQMRQLMQNLIGNALKFHRPAVPPIVKISGKAAVPDESSSDGNSANGMYEISVEDNGIGFEEKYLDRIFTPFQRLHGRGTYEGTGIGLAICRKIVERHGGELTARSSPGIGSTFVVTLPIVQNKEGTNNET